MVLNNTENPYMLHGGREMKNTLKSIGYKEKTTRWDAVFKCVLLDVMYNNANAGSQTLLLDRDTRLRKNRPSYVLCNTQHAHYDFTLVYKLE